MNLRVSARKLPLPDAFVERAERKLRKLDKFFSAETECALHLSPEGALTKVELTLKNRGNVYRAQKAAADKNDALDSAIEHLEKIIVKHKRRLESRLKLGAFADLPEPADAEEEKLYSVIKQKTFRLAPMTAEEAILQMNLVGHSFYLFLSDETGAVNVVYRRENGGYGLLTPEY